MQVSLYKFVPGIKINYEYWVTKQMKKIKISLNMLNN